MMLLNLIVVMNSPLITLQGAATCSFESALFKRNRHHTNLITVDGTVGMKLNKKIERHWSLAEHLCLSDILPDLNLWNPSRLSCYHRALPWW